MAFRTLRQNEQLENPIVVDNSVMMRWLFHDGSEADQSYARQVLSAIGSQNLQIIVPYIWIYEAAFVVQRYSKQNEMAYEQYKTQLTWLFELSLVIRGEEVPARLYEFSYRYGVSAYDAAYVMLALKQSCPLATLDKTIIKISDKANYTLFEL